MGAPSPVDLVDDRLISLPGGDIRLRDERRKSNWHVEVAPFRLDPFPVTRALYEAVVGAVPVVGAPGAPVPHAPGAGALPVTDVSWNDAVRFCNRLSALRGLRPAYRHGDDPHAHDVVWDPTADGYRLPTEAEWEQACRAGTTGERYGDLDAIAWHAGNADGHAHPVGTRAPNAWGLYDTIGNVWEWCWDVYDPDVYGPYRVFRGGGWADAPRALRASCRRRSHPTFHIDDVGFRLARSA